jgi:hypothetical protein
MKRAVTLVAAVFGGFFGISQAHNWSTWICDVLDAYWTRRR